MLTEALLNEVVKSAVGSGFSQIVKAIFARSSGLSESQILSQVVVELRRHGAQIDDIDLRLVRLERITETLITNPGPQQSLAPTTSSLTAPGGLYCGKCGLVPGRGTPKEECNYPYRSHSWVVIESVYCSRCGTIPGESSTCTGPLASHMWKAMEPVFCSTCGQAPGSRRECGVIGHCWERVT